jgi:hypothetical protein
MSVDFSISSSTIIGHKHCFRKVGIAHPTLIISGCTLHQMTAFFNWLFQEVFDTFLNL